MRVASAKVLRQQHGTSGTRVMWLEPNGQETVSGIESAVLRQHHMLQGSGSPCRVQQESDLIYPKLWKHYSGHSVINWLGGLSGFKEINILLTVCLQQNTQDEDPQVVTYAQVSHSVSSLKWVLATPLSSLSGGLQDSEDRQAEEDRWMDSQVGPVFSDHPGFPPPQHQPPLSLSPAAGYCIWRPPRCDLRSAEPLDPQTEDKCILSLPVRGAPSRAQCVCCSGHSLAQKGPRPHTPGRGTPRTLGRHRTCPQWVLPGCGLLIETSWNSWGPLRVTRFFPQRYSRTLEIKEMDFSIIQEWNEKTKMEMRECLHWRIM